MPTPEALSECGNVNSAVREFPPARVCVADQLMCCRGAAALMGNASDTKCIRISFSSVREILSARLQASRSDNGGELTLVTRQREEHSREVRPPGLDHYQ